MSMHDVAIANQHSTLQDIFGVYPYLGDAAVAVSLQDFFLGPQITDFAWHTNAFQFNVINLLPSRTNIIQASTDLTPGSWIDIKTNVATNTIQAFSDPTVPLPPHRFYRAIELQ